MINFDNTILQFGFGAVGKSFFEKVSKEIKFDINKYYVISRDRIEYNAFLKLGGKVGNFVVANVCKENYEELFSRYLREGDFLIDFADTVGTRDFVEWCAKNNIMYLNTGETDWEDNWYNIFDENIKKNELREKYMLDKDHNKYPIVIHHGNNPGLVSHFVKAGLEYVVKNQFKKDEKLHALLDQNKFNELAMELGLKEIHVNDNDFQEVGEEFLKNKLYSTWSTDSFFFEMLSEATADIGTEEKIDYENDCKKIDYENGFVEFHDLAIDKVGKTFYPKGKFEGYLVPHEETVSIARSLEVKKDDKVVYRPTVVFLYSPCEFATDYIKEARVGDKSYTSNVRKQDGYDKDIIVRGFRYPERAEILYKEHIKKGTEYVGVLLLGTKFDPVWVGNRIKKNFLYKNKKDSFWQTPTITPVSMSALSACCWMIKHKEDGGIYFPDDIMDYGEIISLAEKYISKTIYKTFSKKKVERALDINIDNLQLKDILKEY